MNMMTSAEKAYHRIYKAILEDELPRGEFLSQRMLAELAGTSIISVREALKRLEHEHFLESVPRWGVRIPRETRESISDRYALREAIEVMVAYLLSRDIDARNAEELRRRADECDAIAVDDADAVSRFADQHRQLHLFMAECTGRQLLKSELERLGLRSLLYQSARTTWAQRVEGWQRWHRSLVDEILSGDSIRAQEAMHHHVQHGLHHDLQMFDEGLFDV